MNLFNRLRARSSAASATKTYLIVGLGNPGRKYKNNRHNIGFMLADELAARLGGEFSRLQHKALVTDVRPEDKKIILAKPQTYMNNSGQSVGALMRFYKLPLDHLLVVYDDVDLPFGYFRLRPGGGSAGQKGMKSIIQHLGTQTFPRLRLGIGRPPGRMETADYVLQDFPKGQAEELAVFLSRAADVALAFVDLGLEAAMTRYNQKTA